MAYRETPASPRPLAYRVETVEVDRLATRDERLADIDLGLAAPVAEAVERAEALGYRVDGDASIVVAAVSARDARLAIEADPEGESETEALVAVYRLADEAPDDPDLATPSARRSGATPATYIGLVARPARVVVVDYRSTARSTESRATAIADLYRLARLGGGRPAYRSLVAVSALDAIAVAREIDEAEGESVYRDSPIVGVYLADDAESARLAETSGVEGAVGIYIVVYRLGAEIDRRETRVESIEREARRLADRLVDARPSIETLDERLVAADDALDLARREGASDATLDGLAARVEAISIAAYRLAEGSRLGYLAAAATRVVAAEIETAARVAVETRLAEIELADIALDDALDRLGYSADLALADRRRAIASARDALYRAADLADERLASETGGRA